ncbi:Zn-dependent hydrolase [Novosphingobium sp. UBA1939]|uniref:Zn-dependent hydrolase n=1 Tax=Novosphingobium sp. UBA1939 TaxID=1946982 RepID=UPI0025E5B27A|nr:Zn-dependent hydrolase [Novosphingobium sp. UBA1939]
MSLSPDIRAHLDRFLETLDASAAIGPGREGGLSRLTLTESDRRMRDRFVEWCREAGLSVTIDCMGSIFARREGTEDLPPVLVGSHLDTQENGGRFDGIVGVLGALEVVRRLNDLGIATRRPIEIVNWTNEEGARFSPPMVASGCFVGDYALDWALGLKDADGVTIGQALDAIGYRGAAPVGGREIDGYFELHIEQGDVLDRTGHDVGIVTHGYVSHGILVEYRGETAHTGPWPMAKRKNALVAGARLLVAVDDLGWEHTATGGKATAARLSASPNKAGLLSDWAEAVCDVRHDDPEVAELMRVRMLRAVAEAGIRSGCEYRVLDQWSWGGDIFDKTMVDHVSEAAATLGFNGLKLPSQAGHDAYFLAKQVPTAMIFTPCKDGITHNNNELATPDMLAPGLNVLLHAVTARADRP